MASQFRFLAHAVVVVAVVVAVVVVGLDKKNSVQKNSVRHQFPGRPSFHHYFTGKAVKTR